MTLIAAIRTADAMVVVADKRITTKTGFSDDVTKILKVGERAVGCAYVSVRQEQPYTGVVRYDVYKLMEEHFAAKSFSIDSLADFEGHLAAKFVEYRKTYKVVDLPVPVGQAVFKLVFFAQEGDSFRQYRRAFQIRADGSLNPIGYNPKDGHGGVEMFAGIPGRVE